ncbi:hypothetical protein HELRODRAFT_82938, partial [Helobdella robusta]|uniref:FF domain-containing protein n=1 Tax=Helobdella robusta TaxID=6412 RepID=T1G4Y2_HELRO
VSAFSTWEKELPKIVFDDRYLLLPTKDRKLAFDQYLKVRCEEERKEKMTKMKMKKEVFKSLLVDANLSGRTTFSEFCMKHSRDERFKSVEKMKEREGLFNEYMLEIRRRERMDGKFTLDKAKQDFNQMLKDTVPSLMLSTGISWSLVKSYTQYDPRYRVVVEHSPLCETWFKEYCDEELDEDTKRERERRERVEASMRQREKVVQESLMESLQERDKERKVHLREESVQHFRALLTDMVRSSDASWRETRHNLRKDNRWALAKHIDKSEKEKIFEEHISAIAKKTKMAFHKLLDETLGSQLTENWKNVRRMIKDDPRCTKFSSHEKRREKEFDEYLVQRRAKAKQEFRELLKETRIINHRSAQLATDSTQHLKDIIAILQKDKRYLVLDTMPEERIEILTSYIEEIANRGPSPPPTATEPRPRGRDY